MTEVQVRTLASQPTLVVAGTVTLNDAPAFLGDAFAAVYAFIGLRGIEAVGMPFTRYLGFEGECVTIEAGSAVAEAAVGEGAVRASSLPGGEAAIAWHLGPFETIGDTYAELAEWIKAHSRRPAAGMWECYWTDPEQEPDPSKWRTEVIQPLLSGDPGGGVDRSPRGSANIDRS